MNETCKDCKWWRTDSPDMGPHEVPPEGWGHCGLAHGTNNERPGETLAYAVDAEEYQAWLLTSPDYGCNQFSEEG